MKTLVDDNLSIVIPMHNEAENVRPFIHEIANTLRGNINFVIIVVDDGSTDNTLAQLKLLQKELPELKIVRHRKNYGQSAGIISGVKAAPHNWVVTLDGDGQNHPGDILKLVQILNDNSKPFSSPLLVAGIRAERNDNWIRRSSSLIANKIRGALLRDDCPDTGCGIKAFCREDFLNLPYFDHVHRFLPALFKRNGGKIMNVPVQHRPRIHGRSKYGIANRLWVGIVDLLGVVWLVRRPCQPEIDTNV